MSRIRPGTDADVPALTAIWRRSAGATHAFLAPADIDTLEPEVKSAFTMCEVWVVERDGAPAGFIAMNDDMIEALFIDPAYFGQRLGTGLVDHVRDLRGRDAILRVDANEDNPGAVAFYETCGFKHTGRSATDSAGRPWPILHLVLSGSAPVK